MADGTVQARLASLTGLLAGAQHQRDLSWAQRPPATGRAHVRATAGHKGKPRRSGRRVYGMNGPQACARRRHQIAKGMLRVTARETEMV